MSTQKIICIVGPTSSGKSALAVKLARSLPAGKQGEIISADSRQVYRGLDIGTGKITKREMKGVPHHLLDVVSPKKSFTAYDFVSRARREIEATERRGHVPVIAGGTGFYIDVLLGRITLPDVPADTGLRRSLESKTPIELYARLQKADPWRAASIDRANKRRLIRALEIVGALGSVPTTRPAAQYDALWIGLKLPAEELRARINERLRARLKRGMRAEARRLHESGLSYKRMHELGLEYRSLARYLRGELDRRGLEKELQVAIWHYARRQMAYWRRNGDIGWFRWDDERGICSAVEKWLR